MSCYRLPNSASGCALTPPAVGMQRRSEAGSYPTRIRPGVLQGLENQRVLTPVDPQSGSGGCSSPVDGTDGVSDSLGQREGLAGFQFECLSQCPSWAACRWPSWT